MQSYAVYQHPVKGFEAVKKGFSWPAFLFGWIWAFVKQLYSIGVGFIVLYVFVVLFEEVATRVTPKDIASVYISLGFIQIVIHIWFGAKANAWRRLNLKRRGYEHIENVKAETPDAAIAFTATRRTEFGWQDPN